ncbi:hypothetical protein BNJ_00060 [Kaumoebavirus]|nr:hypothetical protein BNJ_00060 [Kaumoebavirus]ARA71902.1 hypothetical protein BNJ_00060 [Kaumoebavirus]
MSKDCRHSYVSCFGLAEDMANDQMLARILSSITSIVLNK